ncbi:MAG: SURF1 family protein [Comamonadaceae bacterium]|nr:MAG: SURF1 family protein [Comamonadaceae bacterium]
MLTCLALLAVVLFVGFTSLGVWQVKRLEWKRALIAQVDARVHADPVSAPGPAQWRRIEDETYRKVQLTGQFLDGEALVQANTELGPGFWVMAPMRTDQGFVALVNRGFVTSDRRDPATRATGAATVVGLLRQTEPDGGFLRANEPGGALWYSRDVVAITRALGLDEARSPVAPYFVDAGPTPAGVWPVGGLTVIQFKNTHAIYALTWFALAFMVAGATWYVARVERRLRRGARDQGSRVS